jgi:hypothetical protein
MRALAFFLAPFLSACMQITTGDGTSSTGAGPVPTSTLAADGGDAAPSGSGCFGDPSGRVVLCEQVSVCPGVAVDPGAFPECGFRLYGRSPLDLECICGDVLCPVGVPTSCADAAQLLDGQSSIAVCEQSLEARCLPLAVPDAASACDQTCASECAGAPSCIQLCGC